MLLDSKKTIAKSFIVGYHIVLQLLKQVVQACDGDLGALSPCEALDTGETGFGYTQRACIVVLLPACDVSK